MHGFFYENTSRVKYWHHTQEFETDQRRCNIAGLNCCLTHHKKDGAVIYLFIYLFILNNI